METQPRHNKLNDPNLKWYRSRGVSSKALEKRLNCTRDAVLMLRVASLTMLDDPSRMLMYSAKICHMYYNAGAIDHLLAVLAIAKFSGIEIDASFFTNKVSRYISMKPPILPLNLVPEGTPFIYNKFLDAQNVFISGISNFESLGKKLENTLLKREIPFLIRSVLPDQVQSDKLYALFSCAILQLQGESTQRTMTIRVEADVEIIVGQKQKKIVTLCLKEDYVESQGGCVTEFWLAFGDVIPNSEHLIPQYQINSLEGTFNNPQHWELPRSPIMSPFSNITHLNIDPEMLEMNNFDFFDDFGYTWASGNIGEGFGNPLKNIQQQYQSPSRKRKRELLLEDEHEELGDTLGVVLSSNNNNNSNNNKESLIPFHSNTVSVDHLMQYAFNISGSHENGIINGGELSKEVDSIPTVGKFSKETFNNFDERLKILDNISKSTGTKIQWPMIQRAMVEALIESNPKACPGQIENVLGSRPNYFYGSNRCPHNRSSKNDIETHSLSGNDDLDGSIMCQSLNEYDTLMDGCGSNWNNTNEYHSPATISSDSSLFNESIPLSQGESSPNDEEILLPNDLYYLASAGLKPSLHEQYLMNKFKGDDFTTKYQSSAFTSNDDILSTRNQPFYNISENQSIPQTQYNIEKDQELDSFLSTNTQPTSTLSMMINNDDEMQTDPSRVTDVGIEFQVQNLPGDSSYKGSTPTTMFSDISSSILQNPQTNRCYPPNSISLAVPSDILPARVNQKEQHPLIQHISSQPLPLDTNHISPSTLSNHQTTLLHPIPIPSDILLNNMNQEELQTQTDPIPLNLQTTIPQSSSVQPHIISNKQQPTTLPTATTLTSPIIATSLPVETTTATPILDARNNQSNIVGPVPKISSSTTQSTLPYFDPPPPIVLQLKAKPPRRRNKSTRKKKQLPPGPGF